MWGSAGNIKIRKSYSSDEYSVRRMNEYTYLDNSSKEGEEN